MARIALDEANATLAPGRPSEAPVRPQEVPGQVKRRPSPAFEPPARNSREDVFMERLCRAFGLGELQGWERLTASGEHSRFVLKTPEGVYVVYAFSRASMSPLGINIFLDLMTYLRQHHFLVPHLMTTRAGARYLSADGRFYVLASSARGLPHGWPYDAQDPQHRREAARGLATYHSLVASYPGPHRLGSTPYLTEALAQSRAWLGAAVRRRGRRSLAPEVREIFLNVQTELAHLNETIGVAYETEPCIPIHGSYDAGALVFDALGLAEVGGFEHSGYDLRLADLAYALKAFCPDGGCEAPFESSGDERTDACEFLSTYRTFAPLSEVETRALPAFLQAGRLIAFVDECRRLVDQPAAQGVAGDIVSRVEEMFAHQGKPPPRPHHNSVEQDADLDWRSQWPSGHETAKANGLGPPSRDSGTEKPAGQE